MSALGSLLVAFNVLVIAFGIHVLRDKPDLAIAGWLLLLSYQLTRRVPQVESIARIVR